MEISSAINEVVKAARARGQMERAFDRWRDRNDALLVAQDVDELIALCRKAPQHLYPAKNDALRALCLEAASGDDLASALLLWLLLPALLAEWKRIDRRNALSTEDLESELLVGFWESVTWIRPTSRKVAARLIQGARRRALAAVKRESAWADATESVDALEDRAATSGDSPDPIAVLETAAREGALSSLDVELLLATPEGIKSIAEREDLTLKTLQVRRGRARTRLIRWLEGHRIEVPSPGDSQRFPQQRPARAAAESH